MVQLTAGMTQKTFDCVMSQHYITTETRLDGRELCRCHTIYPRCGDCFSQMVSGDLILRVCHGRDQIPSIGCQTHPARVRAVPETILGGGSFFFQTPPPPGQTWSQSYPRPPGHLSALINRPHYGSNMP